jgi:hypothetical protein
MRENEEEIETEKRIMSENKIQFCLLPIIKSQLPHRKDEL